MSGVVIISIIQLNTIQNNTNTNVLNILKFKGKTNVLIFLQRDKLTDLVQIYNNTFLGGGGGAEHFFFNKTFLIFSLYT